MSKIHEYIELLKKQRVAKREMLSAREKITSYQHEYSLNSHEDADVLNCINKFEKVLSNNKAEICDDGGYVKRCELFCDLPCADRKCPHFSQNLDYTVAKERYDMAVAARRAFLRGLRGARTK